MNVPDDLLDFFARAKKGQCTVTWTKHEVTIEANGRNTTVARPCTMPQLEAAVSAIKR